MVRSKLSIHLDLKLAVDIDSGKETALVARIAFALCYDRLAAQKESDVSRRITRVAILYASDVLGREPIDSKIGGCAPFPTALVVERAFPSTLQPYPGTYQQEWWRPNGISTGQQHSRRGDRRVLVT